MIPGTSARATPMAASFPISKAGSSSRKPTASSALMAGIGRRWNPAACLPVKTAEHLSPSISPRCASRCTPREQPSSAKAMAPVKAAAPPPAKSTISHSRPQKPMPPNERWRRSANRLGLSFIGKAARPCHSRSHSQRQPLSRQHASAFTPTIRRQFHGHPGTMAAANRHQSPSTSKSRCEPEPDAFGRSAACPSATGSPHRPKSTKAFSCWPNPNAVATSRTCVLSLHSRASSVAATRPIPITCALPNQEPWASK